MIKFLRLLALAIMVKATSNLLAGIWPSITSANPKFLGSENLDPSCFDSRGISHLDSPIRTWAFNLESSSDINTVIILLKDKSERPKKIELRVGSSSDVSKNPLCAVSDSQPASDPGRVWLSCGLKGNFVTVTFCGDDDKLEVRAYSLHGISLRKIVSTSVQLDKSHGSITWVS